MKPTAGVVRDAADDDRRRGVLTGAALAIGVGLLVLLAPQQARADSDPGLLGALGSVVGGVTSTVESTVDPVVAPLPELRELPVVGGLVGDLADSRPVATVTAPVTGLVEGLLGTDVAPVTDPLGGLVDGTVAELAGSSAEPAEGPATPAEALAAAATASAIPASAASLLTPLLGNVGALGIAVVAGAEGPHDRGPVSIPGGLSPTSAVTAGGSPIGVAVAVLGAGLLLLLARGRLRPASFRAPPSPVFATDTSPD